MSCGKLELLCTMKKYSTKCIPGISVETIGSLHEIGQSRLKYTENWSILSVTVHLCRKSPTNCWQFPKTNFYSLNFFFFSFYCFKDRSSLNLLCWEVLLSWHDIKIWIKHKFLISIAISSSCCISLIRAKQKC